MNIPVRFRTAAQMSSSRHRPTVLLSYCGNIDKGKHLIDGLHDASTVHVQATPAGRPLGETARNRIMKMMHLLQSCMIVC